jgi:peptidoglycan-N-acetylglucosamine deacetylase
LWKFCKRPDWCWSISLGICFICWVEFPQLRTVFSIVLVLHIPLLIAGIVNLRLGFFCPAYCANPREKHHLALTFDDGPDPVLTPAILDALEEYGFRATFFVIARRVERYPDIAREIVARGHTIGCHDLEHRVTTNFRLHRKMVSEIGEACSIIANVTGKHPRLYRPPVGLSNPHLRTALAQLDMVCIGWDRSVRDAGNRFVKRLSGIPQLARAGSVILLHDCLPNPQNRDVFLLQLKELCERMRECDIIGVSVDGLFDVVPYRAE